MFQLTLILAIAAHPGYEHTPKRIKASVRRSFIQTHSRTETDPLTVISSDGVINITCSDTDRQLYFSLLLLLCYMLSLSDIVTDFLSLSLRFMSSLFLSVNWAPVCCEPSFSHQYLLVFWLCHIKCSLTGVLITWISIYIYVCYSVYIYSYFCMCVSVRVC